MKVVKVAIEKFKVLKNLTIDLNGKNVILMGENGVGKSSVIQFIKLALGYNHHIPDLEEGKGYVVTNKAGRQYTFYVKYKNGKPTLKVETEDGIIDDRKSVITSIVGGVDFDIDEFVSLSESSAGRKEQVKIYKSFLDPEIIEQLNQLEKKVEMDFNERTDINKEIKRLNALLDQHEGRRYDVADEVDVTALMAEMQKVNERNKQIEKIQSDVNSLRTRVNEIYELIQKLQNERDELQAKIEKGNTWLESNPITSVTKIQEAISNSTETNRQIRLAKEYEKLKLDLAEQQSYAEDATVRIEGSRQAISDAIKDMQVIEDLSFDSDGLLYKGIPVTPTNLSTSEIMELGVKMKMKANQDLGILFLERAESLGEKRLKEIHAMAENNGWQLIMEQVDRGNEKLTVVIEGEPSEQVAH